MTPEAGTGTRAGLRRRWGALAYEILLLAALLLLTGFAILPFVSPPRISAGAAEQLYVLPLASRAFVFLYYFVVLGLYCAWFWTRGRRTLAMKTWGLALATGAGGPLDTRHAVGRYLAAWIGPALGLAAWTAMGAGGIAIGFLNYYWAWVDRDAQFLHDRLAGTRLIRV